MSNPPTIYCGCGRTMDWRPWKTKAGGRYICGHCGWRFWITESAVTFREKRTLPAFDAPVLIDRVPTDYARRLSVMRQWNDQTLGDRQPTGIDLVGRLPRRELPDDVRYGRMMEWATAYGGRRGRHSAGRIAAVG